MENNPTPANPTEDGGETQPQAAGKIVLIGMMASGKSTLGRLLAARRGCPFADADAVIEHEAGKAIADIFRDEGEPAFRRREAAVIAALLAAPGAAVLALGGGAFCQSAVRESLRGRGTSVFLRVAEEDILARLARSDVRTRPMIAGDGWRGRVREILRARYPVYAGADMVFDIAGGESPAKSAERLEQYLTEALQKSKPLRHR